jgi:NADPH-dependent 2,4-dienoyl-CoA reductase/sulfur reductase-like enzyme
MSHRDASLCHHFFEVSQAQPRQDHIKWVMQGFEHAGHGRIQRLHQVFSRSVVPHIIADRLIATEPVDAFRQCAATYLPGASVWNVMPDRTVWFIRDGATHQVRASAIIVATGALERPFPVPGWTLPGVMGACAAQILLKTAALAPSTRTVLIGSGPLLYQLAAQYVAAARSIAALLDLAAGRHRAAALPHLPRALLASSELVKGLSLLREIRRAGIPTIRHASDVRIEGNAAVQAVSFERRGRRERLEADLAVLHHGVIPHTQMTRLLRCEHEWDAAQRCFRPVLTANSETSVENVFVAGDGSRIGGALAAQEHGFIVGLRVAQRLAAKPDDAASTVALAQWHKRLARHLAVRPFLDALYPPALHAAEIADETLVCRCEEVSAGELRKIIGFGCMGPNQAKTFTRCGMGPCQGRMCGSTVTEMFVAQTGRVADEIGYYRIRPPIRPLTLGELTRTADGAQDDSARDGRVENALV